MSERESEPVERVSAFNTATFAGPAKRALATLAVVRPIANVAGRFFSGPLRSDDPQTGSGRGGVKYLISLLILVVFPTFVSSIYFTFIASDQYSAEARFAVTSARFDLLEKVKSSSLGVNGLPSSTGQDAYIISAYIHSRSIVEEISRKINLREVFRRPEADFWARLSADATAEELADYWRSKVGVYVDSISGIVTIDVRAFRREDALRLCEAVVKASEELANSVSARAQQYTIKLAETEVARAENKVVSSLDDLRQFREHAGFIDPTSQAKAANSILTDLLSDKIKLQNQYFVSSRAMSKDAPTVQTMKSRLDSLDTQIAEQRAKLTGVASETDTLASLMPKFESLELQNRFAEKIYSLAQDGLERARLRAEAQAIYVNAFVPASLPEEAEYPQRTYTILSIAFVLSVLWGIGAMIFAIVEDHRI
jgi:capsular polysaccharide transport system permease protein